MKGICGKVLVFMLLFVLTFYSCVKDVSLDFKGFQDNLVVNSLLVPDSFMVVNLSLSASANNKEIFPDISNSIVEISDDIEQIELKYGGNGNYFSSHYPISGKAYKLRVLQNNRATMKSQTKIPGNPKINITSIPDKNLVKVTITDNPLENNNYWIGLKVHGINDPITYYETYFYSDFILFDDFNRTNDGEVIEGIKYSYHFFARLNDSNINGKEISFYTPRKWPKPEDIIDYKFVLYIINADEHLDKYMKSALIQYELGVIGDMPVFHTPIDMYSNIENGKGIFGSYTLSQFDITTP